MCIDSDDHLCSEKVVENALKYWDSEIEKLRMHRLFVDFWDIKRLKRRSNISQRAFILPISLN